jgi:hypothetical protein
MGAKQVILMEIVKMPKVMEDQSKVYVAIHVG